MTDIGVEGIITPLKQGEEAVRGRDVSIAPDAEHRNFPTVDDVQELYSALDGVNVVPGTGRSPYKYFQKLEIGTGEITQLPTSNQILNSSTDHKFTHTLVPVINTNGGIIADVPFFSEYYGAIRGRVTTAVTMVITARFYHFSGEANEFSSTQRIARRFSSNRETEVSLRDLSSPPIVLTLGQLVIPGGPTFDITEDFLNTPFPFRIELEFESFDVTTGEINTDTVLSNLELVEPTIAFIQEDLTVLGSDDEASSAGVLRFTFGDGRSLPTLDGSTQTSLNNSLAGVTDGVKRGYAFRFSPNTLPAGTTSYTQGNFTEGDILVAKIDSPSNSLTSDWLILRDGADFPVSEVEAHFLDTISEPTDAQFRASTAFRITGDNLTSPLHDAIYDRDERNLGPVLADFQNRLTETEVAGSAWSNAPNPQRYASSYTRLFALGWDENRVGATPFTGNYFDDLADPTIAAANGSFFYFDADHVNDQANVRFPGAQSYVTGRVDVSGLPLTNTFEKQIGVEFYISRETLPDGTVQPLTSDLSLIKAGTRTLVGVDSTGLYVFAGNGTATTVASGLVTRLYRTAAQNESIQYLRGTGANSVSYFVPDNLTFPLALTVRFRVVDSGQVGAFTDLAYTVTDRAVSQSQQSQTVTMNIPGGTRDETITTQYDSVTNTVIIGTTGLALNTTQDVTQIGMTITYADTVQLNTSDDNVKRYVDTGSDSLVNRPISLMFILELTVGDTTDADPFLTWKAVVNGRQENDENLNRRETEYDFSDIQFGPDSGDEVAVSRIQIYEWNNGGVPFDTPTHAELYRAWQHRNEWIGLFLHPDQANVKFSLNGDLGLTNINIGGTIVAANIIEDVGVSDGYRWEIK